MIDETKYYSPLNIFSHSPYTLSSSPTYSASTLSRFLSRSSFNPMPQIHTLISQLLHKLSSSHNTAFLIADTTRLRKTGSKFEGVKKVYDPSLKKTLFAHRALVIVLSVGRFRIPLHLEILRNTKPVDALIVALKRLLPTLRSFLPNLVFLCDAGLTCNKLLSFLLSQEIDFVCGVSQGRKDEETGEKLIDLWFPEPERVKIKGVGRSLYAYRLGEGTDKERIVVSNIKFSKKKFESYYRSRWQIESEIKVLKSLGLESHMVRKLRAIRLWIMAVWHVALLKLVSRLEGFDFKRYLLSLVFPPFVLLLIDLLGFVEVLVGRCLRFSPFPDDRLVLFLLRNLIGGGSCYAKV